MRQLSIRVLVAVLAVTATACKPVARSQESFDQLRTKVAGLTELQVERILGKPNSRRLIGDEERCTWYRYTFLDGEQYVPEVRGQVVHLTITFESPVQPGSASSPPPHERWRVPSELAVGYVPESNSQGADDEPAE